MYYEGQGVEKDDYLGKKWIMLSAEQGVEEAKVMVSIWESENNYENAMGYH